MEVTNKKIGLLFILIFLIGISGALLFNYYYLITEVVIFEMDVNVSLPNQVGFNLDKDKMHFGEVPISGSSGFRTITLENEYDDTMKVIMNAEGEIEDWLVYEADNQTYNGKLITFLEPGEKKDVKITLDVPWDATVGKLYEGELMILWKKEII